MYAMTSKNHGSTDGATKNSKMLLGTSYASRVITTDALTVDAMPPMLVGR